MNMPAIPVSSFQLPVAFAPRRFFVGSNYGKEATYLNNYLDNSYDSLGKSVVV
jgi:hypothetical protein